jgi:hypothetical protein
VHPGTRSPWRVPPQGPRRSPTSLELGPTASTHEHTLHRLAASLDALSAEMSHIPRFRALRVIVNFQPFWMFPDEWIKQDAKNVVGRARARHLYRLRSIARTGVRVAAGSDWPVTTPNPFLAIQVGTTRQPPDPPFGAPWIPAERVSRRKLLAAYTTGGAYVNRREHETGSLEVGKAADFAIVDRNPLTVPVHRLGRIRVLKTFVDGEEVYAAPSAADGHEPGSEPPPRQEMMRGAERGDPW